MKKYLAIILLSISTLTTATVSEPVKPTEVVEKKKVCIKVWDAKLNKEVEKCRTMKIREKKEGTNVPTK